MTGALQGVDVASFQHPNNAAINWTQVAGAGIQFAAVKATEGNHYKNPFAPADLADAQAAGLSVIAYAFAIPNGNGGSRSPAVQADYLLSYLGASNSGVPVLLDIEYDPYVSTDGTNSCYGLSQSAMVNWISGFDSEVQAKTGRLPIIYTTANWWSTCTGNSTAFGQTPMWVANFTTAASPALPAGWELGPSGSTQAPAPWPASAPPGLPTSTSSTRPWSRCSAPVPAVARAAPRPRSGSARRIRSRRRPRSPPPACRPGCPSARTAALRAGWARRARITRP